MLDLKGVPGWTDWTTRPTGEADAHLYYIGDVLNNVLASLYVDYAHISPRGNAIVADRIFTMLEGDKASFDKTSRSR